MKFSIIICAYNGLEHTRTCIESIYAHVQNITSFECIVINDGSTDKTEAYLIHIQKRYANLRVVNHPDNKGLIIRRNEGLHLSQGEYLLFLDNDTKWTGNILSLIEEKMLTLPEVGIVGMCGIFIPAMTASYHLHASLIEQDVPVQAVAAYCMAVSRKVINQHIRFDEQLHFMQHEDIDICLQALEKGFTIYAIAHVPLIHTEHGTFSYYKDTYEGDFKNNWLYLMNKWSGAHSFFGNTVPVSFEQRKSKSIGPATFYDLV